VFELGMELLGGYGAVVDDKSPVDGGRFPHGFFLSFANTIAGGSSEIQRNIIAQRVLGLPR
jgi:alkylation response protein AidB-like acyl-CoA dehydrogenase